MQLKDDGGVARSAGSWGRYMSFQHQNVCICIHRDDSY